MASRSVPRKATSRLDLGARLANSWHQAEMAQIVEAASPVRPRAARVTWLGDMLTPEHNSFGVVRLLLALAVLVSHSVYLTTGQGPLEPLYRWTNYTLGQHGVQLFFFLSGILVAQSLFKSGCVRDYAAARGLRIFPALIVCVLLTALVAGPLVSTLPARLYLSDAGVYAYIAKTLSLWSGSGQLPGVFQDTPVSRVVNTSVWTLKYEVLCYVLFAIGGALILKLSRWREAAAAVAAIWLAAIFYQPAGLTLHGGAQSFVDVLRYFLTFFGTGVLAFALRRTIPIHALLLVPAAALFWFAIGTRFQEPAAAVGLGYGVLWLSSLTFGRLRAFANRNDYSYATYLYHMPVAQIVLHVQPQMHVVPLILITSGIVLMLAFLSWELVERPALRLRHSLWATPKGAKADVAAAAMAPRADSTSSSLTQGVEPGVAHVWRPMSAGQKVRIVPDDGVKVAMPPHVPATVRSGTMRPQATSAATNGAVDPAAETIPRVAISAGRMALATQRRAAPAVADLGGDLATAVRESSRGVVVADADDQHAAGRTSRPRPTWSRPIVPGQAIHL